MSLKDRVRRAGSVIGIGVSFGLATGLVEGLELWFRQVALGQIMFASRHVLWMAPLDYAIIFGALSLIPALIGMIAPRSMPSKLVVFGFATLGAACLVLPIDQLHKVAKAILALAFGKLVYEAITKNGTLRLRRVGIGLGSLAVLAVIAGGVSAIRRRALARSVAGPVSAARPGAPNVLLIVWDTVRAISLSLYGYPRATTPELERLAPESVVFERAYSTSPWTLPSHASMFTGRFPYELSTSWYSRLDGRHPTLAEIFGAAGYRTGGFAGNHHYTSFDSGLDRGFETYFDYKLTFDQIARSSALAQTANGWRIMSARSFTDVWQSLRPVGWEVNRKRSSDPTHAAELSHELLAWIDHPDERPFFAFVNMFDAHEYWAPESVLGQFPGPASALRGYDAAIRYQDDQVADLLRALAQRGRLDNTIVILVADHGELLGEHRLTGHAHNLYLPVLHVPLLVRYPGSVPPGLRIKDEVSLRDLAATIVDLAGSGINQAIPGRSLRRFWDAGHAGADSLAESIYAEVEHAPTNPRRLPNSRGPLWTVIDRGYQLIRLGDLQEQLFEAQADSSEVDLLSRSEVAPELRSLRAQLEAYRRHGAVTAPRQP